MTTTKSIRPHVHKQNRNRENICQRSRMKESSTPPQSPPSNVWFKVTVSVAFESFSTIHHCIDKLCSIWRYNCSAFRTNVNTYMSVVCAYCVCNLMQHIRSSQFWTRSHKRACVRSAPALPIIPWKLSVYWKSSAQNHRATRARSRNLNSSRWKILRRNMRKRSIHFMIYFG